jgi:class 3 adenylate cyclase
LVVTAFVTVDGVIEAPGFDEHRDGRNAWALRVQGDDDGVHNRAQALSADALLLGRKTWQSWAAFWPTAPDEAAELREHLNRIPKYVVSRTLQRADWNNSTIISGDIGMAVAELKAKPGGELVVYGSADLVDELLKHDLVDEYRLLIYPLILGSGKHLFRDRIDTHHLRLVRTQTFRSGVVLLTYVPEAALAPMSELGQKFEWTPEQIRVFQAGQTVDRILATVLFADIVDSTGRAAAMGDRAWRAVLDRYVEIVRDEVGRWMGGHLEVTGDGVMATFDTPTRALRCAFGLHDAVTSLGIAVRAGLHTGEIERREGGIGGIGVHIAARVMGHAGPREVLATRTVRDLATGADLAFEPRGVEALRGVPGTWELFAVSLR